MRLELSNIAFPNRGAKYAIYGTGEIGRMLKRTLNLWDGIEVKIFLCSDGYKNNEEIIDGIHVLELAEFAKNNSEVDCEILLTVQNGAEEILKSINDKVNNKVIEINSQKDVLLMYRFFYEMYFKKLGIGIDRSKEYIALKDVRFLNPFISDDAYALAFFMECGDLILPAIYNDLTCIHEGPYENKYFKVDANDVVFDCGSNMGLFAFVVSNRCNKVYAFEPVKSTQEYIKKMLNAYRNIQICDYALSDEVGTANFSLDSGTSFSNHLVKDNRTRNSITVNVTTIDQFVEENGIEKLDFIKADIEGAERNMLKGARKTLERFAPKLAICEYHLSDDPQVLEEIILDANPKYVVKHEYMKIYAYVEK